ncbi:reverse transcriptase domain-containing protein [Alteromonas lipotrueae]|uniref:reverse transcriptase domain-containing protein n=1 Tax=Alteromonas lipotrueae TaxID=2803814 RepID=UPI001C4646A3|nr:reverse transcriptase domain-containing protein [Alteromonas lipotrueae]
MFGITEPKTLNECFTVESLAKFLGTDYSSLAKLLYSKRSNYRTFYIPKKTGGTREIKAPTKRLRFIQQKLKVIFEEYSSPRAASHGFVKKRSIVTNAQHHVGRAFVLNVDLEDFFGSINFGRIKRLFESQPFNLAHPIATVLAQICCHEGCLPQGAPTSPLLSNMIAFKLDGALMKMAKGVNFRYTRYVDDLTISCQSLTQLIKHKIVQCDKDGKYSVGFILNQLIEQNGFKTKSDKTRLQKRGEHQGVTGLTVNEKINVSRTFIRQTSSMIHALIKFGAEKAEKEHFTKYFDGYIPIRQQQRLSKFPGDLFIKKLKGRVNYIKMIRGSACPVYRKLAYQLTIGLGCPNEDYNKDWLNWISESVLVLDNNLDSLQGTAFFAKDIGFVTNQHNLKSITKDNFSGKIKLTEPLNYSKSYPLISFLKSSEELDIALIDFNIHEKSKRPLEIAESFVCRAGQTVYAIGYPNHAEGSPPTILECKIIDRAKWDNQLRIKIDQNIHHGFSGGAVIDTDGKLVGIVSNGNAVGAPHSTDNMFIPIETLLTFASED